MKLQQGQLWKCQDSTLRITRLERLAVEYKLIPETPEAGADPEVPAAAGSHHRATKKEFCRLIKGAVLVTPAA